MTINDIDKIIHQFWHLIMLWELTATSVNDYGARPIFPGIDMKTGNGMIV